MTILSIVLTYCPLKPTEFNGRLDERGALTAK
jgi:hypothetical protein